MSNTLKVLQFSTHNEDCGIAKYQQQFVDNMSDESRIVTKYFKYSPNQTKNMSTDEFQKVLNELILEMEHFDILHIQHELSFFKNYELKNIVNAFRNTNKKLIVTVHTAPQAQFIKARVGGLGPKSLVNYMRSKGSNLRFIGKYINPLKYVDLILVHNAPTQENLVSFGIPIEKIKLFKHPVSDLIEVKASNEIKSKFKINDGDIVYATIGFISKSKGVFHAVKALNYLPPKYKLAVIGGVHPDANDVYLLDELADYIHEHGLSERVYITGFIKEDQKLNELISEVDICVYPYNKHYYDYVSSGSLNLAMANGKPVIAYKTRSLQELNERSEVVKFTKSGNYYELARAIKEFDMSKYTQASYQYSKDYSWSKQAKELIEIYINLAN